MVNHVTTPAIKTAPMTPPTTPPAIAPVFEEDDCGADDDSDEFVVVAIVDGLPRTDVGTMVTLPVISGESVPTLSIHQDEIW
jgi:hypothetical protein